MLRQQVSPHRSESLDGLVISNAQWIISPPVKLCHCFHWSDWHLES
jgi:hypothetical protein